MVDAAEVAGDSTTIGAAAAAGEVATTGTAMIHSTRGRTTIILAVIRVVMALLEADRTLLMDAVAPGDRPVGVDTEAVVVATRISHRRTHLPDLLILLLLRQIMAVTVVMVVGGMLLHRLRTEVMAVAQHPPEGVHHHKTITLTAKMIVTLVTELEEGMGVDMVDVEAERPDTTVAEVGMAVRAVVIEVDMVVRAVVIEVVTAVLLSLVDTIALDMEGVGAEEVVVEVVITNLCLQYL